jgi:hypothetical protein
MMARAFSEEKLDQKPAKFNMPKPKMRCLKCGRYMTFIRFLYKDNLLIGGQWECKRCDMVELAGGRRAK